MRKIAENLCSYNWPLGSELNLVPSEYEAGMLLQYLVLIKRYLKPINSN
jgi:hypothetical protein